MPGSVEISPFARADTPWGDTAEEKPVRVAGAQRAGNFKVRRYWGDRRLRLRAEPANARAVCGRNYFFRR